MVIIMNKAKQIWDNLGDIPIDNNECIEVEFMDFPIGTHREEIWIWIESFYNISVVNLMFPNRVD